MSRCSYDTVGPRAKGKRVGVKSRRWLGVRKRQSRSKSPGDRHERCRAVRALLSAPTCHWYCLLYHAIKGKGILNARHGCKRCDHSVRDGATRRRHGGGEAGDRRQQQKQTNTVDQEYCRRPSILAASRGGDCVLLNHELFFRQHQWPKLSRGGVRLPDSTAGGNK